MSIIVSLNEGERQPASRGMLEKQEGLWRVRGWREAEHRAIDGFQERELEFRQRLPCRHGRRREPRPRTRRGGGSHPSSASVSYTGYADLTTVAWLKPALAGASATPLRAPRGTAATGALRAVLRDLAADGHSIPEAWWRTTLAPGSHVQP